MKQLVLRAHHGMCLAFFEGKGYNDIFTTHMKQIQVQLTQNPMILVTAKADSICDKCPNLKQNICEKQEQTAEYDHKVLSYCGILEDTIMTWKNFSKLIQEQILYRGKRKEICGFCQWSYLCEEKEKLFLIK